MARSLERRVSRLEERAGGGGKGPGGECPECGGPDDFGPVDSYELVWVDPGGPEDREEFCPGCGRQTTIVVGGGDEA